MGAEPKVPIDVSVCFDTETLLWLPFRLAGVPEGLRLRPLRRLDDGSLRSAVVRAPSGWESGGHRRLLARLQIYVTQGELRVGQRNLKTNAYLNYPAGSVLPTFGSTTGTEFLLVCDGPPAFEPASNEAAASDGMIIEDVVAEFEAHTGNDGGPENMGGLTLCEDPISGGTTRFLKVPPNWTSPGPEYHPCQEEIFCLSGDIAPDDIRILKPGWFLWNPAYGVHGFNLHSVKGGTVLEWHDGPWQKLAYAGA